VQNFEEEATSFYFPVKLRPMTPIPLVKPS
jgi:hypothetical protein